MNMLILFLGQIPEAIYFALFLIFTKKLNTHRLVFCILSVIEYLLLMCNFMYNWYFHIFLIFVLYVTLKVVYKEKSQITDVFLILISFIYLGLVCIITYFVFSKLYPNMIVATIVNRLLLFIPILKLNYKLNSIQKLYKKYWNRNSIPKRMKSVTFRSINVVVFNIMFVVLNICMLYAVSIINK